MRSEVQVFPGPPFIGGVAQLGEHLLCKQKVVGSIPIASTTLRLRLRVAGHSEAFRRRSVSRSLMAKADDESRSFFEASVFARGVDSRGFDL